MAPLDAVDRITGTTYLNSTERTGQANPRLTIESKAATAPIAITVGDVKVPLKGEGSL
jgi:hypothetical protein